MVGKVTFIVDETQMNLFHMRFEIEFCLKKLERVRKLVDEILSQNKVSVYFRIRILYEKYFVKLSQ